MSAGPTPPPTAAQEREKIVAWLDQWATTHSGANTENSDYNAGWVMACFNAAREIERGDHQMVENLSDFEHLKGSE